MPTLWLTYAWKDNEAEQVDFAVAELERAGLNVLFDRAHLVAGQRIWPQLDKAITDPATTDGWAIYVTKTSLESEACQEELAYALDRALETRGFQFPIIGIFPEAVDRQLIPRAIATRLYVDLRDPAWPQKVVSGLVGQSYRPDVSRVAPFHAAMHRVGTLFALEVRPRAGSWAPFRTLVSAAEGYKLDSVVTGLPGQATGSGGARNYRRVGDHQYAGVSIDDRIDALTSAFIYFTEVPPEVHFGTADQNWTIRLSPDGRGFLPSNGAPGAVIERL